MTQQAMCGSVRYRDAETAVPALPLVAPLLPNCIEQPLHNLHVKMTSNTLSRLLTLFKILISQTPDDGHA
jgi:hypothetical protein